MTSSCTDSRFEAMLHAYELGMLDDAERQAVELHLLECESCFTRLREFSEPARLMRHDLQIRLQVDHLAAEPDNSEAAPAGWLRSKFSAVPTYLRYLTAAALVLLVGASVYWFAPQRPVTEAAVQTLSFSDVRSGSTATVDLSHSGLVRLRFPVGEQRYPDEYSVVLAGSDNQVLLSMSPASAIDSSGYGQVEFNSSLLKPGLYRVHVSSRSDSLAPSREYVFRAR